MTLDEIKQLVEFIKGHDLDEFELEQDGVKVRIKRGSNHHAGAAAPQAPAATPVSSPAPVASPVSPPPAAAPADEGGELAIVKSPIVGTFYRVGRARRQGVRLGRRHRAQGPGAVHHRGDEADERDRFRVRRRGHERLRGERAGGPVRRAPVRDPADCINHVQKNPRRQSWRNRAARDFRVPRAGHQDRGGVLGSRRELAARAVRRRRHLHRPGAQRRQLFERAGHHQRRRNHRRRRAASRLRFSVRERLSRRGVRSVSHPVHRPRPERDPAARRQVEGAPRDEEGRRADAARQRRPGGERGEGDQDRPDHRLPGDHQGGGGRRRARHAHRQDAGRAAARVQDRAAGGRVGVRRRRRLHREVPRGAAAYRVPDSRRPSRQRGAPGRARVLDPAAAPEAARRIAVGRGVGQGAPQDGQRRRGRRARRPVHQCRARSSSSWTRRATSSSWR